MFSSGLNGFGQTNILLEIKFPYADEIATNY